MKIRLSRLALAGLVGVTLLLPRAASASTLAYEIIADVTGSNTDLTQDLRRTRQILPNAPVVVDNDATIISENLVNTNFGKFNSGNVTYSHLLTWLAPPAASYLNVILTIMAYDSNGNNDDVVADAVNLGSLTMGNDTLTSTVFTNGTLLANIVDGNLNISINKQGENNGLNIISSRLDVEYNPTSHDHPPSVPEPASLVLVGMGLVGIARRRFPLAS